MKPNHTQIANTVGLAPEHHSLLAALARVVEERVAPLTEEIARLRALQEREGPSAIPPQRKYTADEVRLRLYTGRDPNALTDDEREDAEANALSVRSIERLVSSGVLERLLIGGSRFFSETQVQAYERRVAEGKVRRPAARRGGKRPAQRLQGR